MRAVCPLYPFRGDAVILQAVTTTKDGYLVSHDKRTSRYDHKLIILSLDGNLEHQGFRVAVELGLDGERPMWAHRGQLPAAPDLLMLLNQWRQDYCRLGSTSRLFMRLTPQEIEYTGSINDPFTNCQQSAQVLQRRLRQWLTQAEQFQDINLRLREFCSLDDRIRVIIRANDPSIYRLPWHQWDFIDRYQEAEIAFSGLTAEGLPALPNAKGGHKVKILALLGDPCDINIDGDRALLDALPDAEVTFLVQPDRSVITDQLWNQPWDILFFAGHSKTETSNIAIANTAEEGGHRLPEQLEGRIYLNRTDSLSLDELTFGLRQAIRQGLRLAIFNSCDGLGLASALEKLHLPQFIVMREPIPDKIAQTFLNRFLQSFSTGNSFYRSVRQAREQLQGFEQDYPCASWLPVIYQDVSARSLHWSDFLAPIPPVPASPASTTSVPPAPSSQNPAQPIPAPRLPETSPSDQVRADQPVPSPSDNLPPLENTSPRQSWLIRCVLHCGVGLIMAGLTIGLRTIGVLQPLELKAYDHLVRQRPNQTLPDNRLLVISIDEEDIQYQRQQGMVLDGSLSDTALLALLQKIEPHQPAVIGVDILHDFEFPPPLDTYVEQHSHIFSVCRDKTPGQPGVAAPANISTQQLGFTNTPLDPDGIVRRQFLGEPEVDTLCQTQLSLAFQLARRYLETVEGQGMIWQSSAGSDPSNVQQQLMLGSTLMPKVTRRAGGYHLPKGEDGGYQLLINYRAMQPTRVTLREVLGGTLNSQLPDLIRDRIILIGVVDQKTDLHMTPYNQGTPMNAIAGVMIQAQTASHIISAVIDDRPLIQWWSEKDEILWIVVWGAIGGLSIVIGSSMIPRWLILGAGLLLLYLGCLVLLLQGLWVPFVPAGLTFISTTLMPLNKLRGHTLR